MENNMQEIQDHPLEQVLSDTLITNKRLGEETNELLETGIKQHTDTQKVIEDSLVIQSRILNETKKANEIAQQEKPQKITLKTGNAPVTVKGAKGEKGEPGNDGKDGKNGRDGIDGRDGKDGKDGKDGYTPVKGVDYFDGQDGKKGKDGKDGLDGDQGEPGEKGVPGKDGRDGSPDTGPDIVKKLSDLKGKERLSLDSLRDVPNLLAMQRQASKTVSLAELDDVILTGLTRSNGKYVLGSGVQSVVAGTNISVNSADPANPIISATDAFVGTVTSVSVVTANGISGSVATATTTPAITLSLGAITPTTVNGLTVTTSTGTLTVANGKTLTANNTIALAGTDATTMTFPGSNDTVAGLVATQTLTNKRVAKRAPSITQSATPTINTDNTDVAHITGLAQNITSMSSGLSGTPVEGDTLRIDITDNGSARTITWGSSFESSGTVTLPTTTTSGVRLDIGFFWNTATSKWRCVAVA